jgi:predicted Mrr-cat superfamily restriction endonuclease
MMYKLACATAVAIMTISAVPALEKEKTAGCSEASMAKADGMMMKMPEGENKTMAMQEMTAAKSSMSQQDMAGCSMHMNKAMKMTSMKPKKM